jgi:protein-S-isoprenylcysteine O-methyltransferase Ste14
MPEDNPGGWFPPPIVFVLATAGAALLRRKIPLPIGGEVLRPIAAWALVGVAFGLIAGSFQSFWSRRTSVVPIRPATTLVVAGPYAVTRNPMYVALVLLTAGSGLWLNTWWAFVLLVPAVLVIDRYVIRREEAYLLRRFGAGYDAYTRRVRRWL